MKKKTEQEYKIGKYCKVCDLAHFPPMCSPLQTQGKEKNFYSKSLFEEGDKMKKLIILILGLTIIVFILHLRIQDSGSKTCIFFREYDKYLPLVCLEFPTIRQTSWSFYEK